ncbi:MAG: S8 family serine peptidase [Planctomycetota bacterium]
MPTARQASLLSLFVFCIASPVVGQPVLFQFAAPQYTDVDPARVSFGDLPVAQHGLHSQLLYAELTWADPTLSFAEKKRRLAAREIELREDGKVRVELFRPVGEEAVTRAQLLPFGGEVIYRVRSAVEGYLPADQLSACAALMPAGTKIKPCGLGLSAEGANGSAEGSGPLRTEARDYRLDGFNGSGMTIGIVDVSYGGYLFSVISGDAPAPITAENYTASSMYFTERQHGRMVMETIFDYAPAAEYRLAKISSLTQAALAVDDMVAEGVHLMNLSLGFVPEWDDDSDVLCAAVNSAGAAGTLIFKSCGNRADCHYLNTFFDPDGDDFHNFAGTTDEMLTVAVPDEDWARFNLRWDTTMGNEDFDLILLDASGTVTLSASTAGGTTFEDVSWENTTGSAVLVQVMVRRNTASPATQFEIYSDDGLTWPEHRVPTSSYTSPANATHPNVLAIGAVNRQWYSQPNGTNAIITAYSSRGPSKGGAQVPDFSCVVRTGGSFFSSFIGTSCAAPNAAGVCATLWSANPTGNASGVRAVLEDWAAQYRDWGAAGPDPIYGIGGVCMTPLQDCNTNDYPDAFEILSGAFDDDNGDWVPDPCQSPGYQLDLVAPDNVPVHPTRGGLLKIYTWIAGNDNDPAGPLDPSTGFSFTIEYDDTVLVAPTVTPTPSFSALLGSSPAVFNVTHTPSGTTGGPAMTTVDCIYSAAGGVATTFPTATPVAEFDFDITPGAVALGSSTSVQVATGALAPSVNTTGSGGTPIPMYILSSSGVVELFEHTGFVFDIEDARLTVDATAGAATLSTDVLIEEELPLSVAPTPVGALYLGADFDRNILAVTGISMADELLAINGGLGPAFFLPVLTAGGFTIDCTFDTTSDNEMFPIARRFFTLEFDVDPGLFLATENTVSTGTVRKSQDSFVFGTSPYEVFVDDALVTIVVEVNSGEFIRADANIDGNVNIGDPVATLAYLFSMGPAPCLDAMDSNDDGSVDIADPVATLSYLFSMGAEPPAPFPDSGEDTTLDSAMFDYDLGCENTL